MSNFKLDERKTPRSRIEDTSSKTTLDKEYLIDGTARFPNKMNSDREFENAGSSVL